MDHHVAGTGGTTSQLCWLIPQFAYCIWSSINALNLNSPHIFLVRILIARSWQSTTPVVMYSPTAYPIFFVAVLVALFALLISVLLPNPSPCLPLLSAIAAHQFAWSSSTTSAPISSVSVLAKRVLSRDPSLPPALQKLISKTDTISVQSLRQYTNAQRLQTIKHFCHHNTCNPSEVDPLYSLTPLHLAAATSDQPLSDFLSHLGATPIPDHVGRLPRNLTFSAFISNSKRFARLAGRTDCDFPVVEFDGSPHAISETRRLISEGEPVLLRGAFHHYGPSFRHWTPEEMIQRYGHASVAVGHVPYAPAFNLSSQEMTLRQYYEMHVRGGAQVPLYVFNKGDDVCQDGYDALLRLFEEALPKHIIEHPNNSGGMNGIHFFLGAKGSGAPFHIHADALNAAVSGLKKWFVYTPARTIYSRKTIKRWAEEDYPELKEQERPLECIQKPGDVVYVPLDWGHAVLNMEEDTFGFALEVLNKRDTWSHLWK